MVLLLRTSKIFFTVNSRLKAKRKNALDLKNLTQTTNFHIILKNLTQTTNFEKFTGKCPSKVKIYNVSLSVAELQQSN